MRLGWVGHLVRLWKSGLLSLKEYELYSQVTEEKGGAGGGMEKWEDLKRCNWMLSWQDLMITCGLPWWLRW